VLGVAVADRQERVDGRLVLADQRERLAPVGLA
jgi:hypothetical protein